MEYQSTILRPQKLNLDNNLSYKLEIPRYSDVLSGLVIIPNDEKVPFRVCVNGKFYECSDRIIFDTPLPSWERDIYICYDDLEGNVSSTPTVRLWVMPSCRCCVRDETMPVYEAIERFGKKAIYGYSSDTESSDDQDTDDGSSQGTTVEMQMLYDEYTVEGPTIVGLFKTNVR